MSTVPDGVRGAIARARLALDNARANEKDRRKLEATRPFEGNTADALAYEELYPDPGPVPALHVDPEVAVVSTGDQP